MGMRYRRRALPSRIRCRPILTVSVCVVNIRHCLYQRWLSSCPCSGPRWPVIFPECPCVGSADPFSLPWSLLATRPSAGQFWCPVVPDVVIACPCCGLCWSLLFLACRSRVSTCPCFGPSCQTDPHSVPVCVCVCQWLPQAARSPMHLIAKHPLSNPEPPAPPPTSCAMQMSPLVHSSSRALSLAYCSSRALLTAGCGPTVGSSQRLHCWPPHWDLTLGSPLALHGWFPTHWDSPKGCSAVVAGPTRPRSGWAGACWPAPALAVCRPLRLTLR